MAIHTSFRGKRLVTWVSASLLLTTVGCGFPHGRYGGDPMMGSFNRPITATPPIFTGGDPGVSPAWDAGARMGMPSPDVPAQSNPILKRSLILPTFGGSLGLGGMLGGGSDRASASPAPAAPRIGNTATAGATLMPGMPANYRTVAQAAPIPALPNPGSVVPRPLDQHTLLTSGSAIEPPVQPRPIEQAVYIKDPRTVMTVEEGQQILQTHGGRSMSMDPQPTGDWRFSCVVGDGPNQKRYEAKHGDQVEAMRAVLWQLKNDK